MSAHLILNLIKSNTKHYTRLIRKDPTLMSWINNNKLITSDNFVEEIFSAVYQESNICELGNKRKISRFNEGWVGCGPAKSCVCTRESIKSNVSLTKSKISREEKEISNSKRNQTMLEKYGYEFNSLRPDVKQQLSKPKIPLDVHSKLSNKDWLKEEYINKKRSQVDIANELNVYYGTVCEYLKQHDFKIRKKTNYSLVELEIEEYLKSLNVQCKTSYWDLLGNKEIDIFIPSKNIAIEVNGLYWHSYGDKKIEYRNRHLDKTIACEKLNIELLHITDYEWNNKKDIVKNLLKSKLGLNEKIFARKCEIKTVSNSICRNFLNKYHIQGSVSSKFNYGLFFNDELIMILTLGSNRFNQLKTNLEILRICSKNNITVIGGLSKLLKHAKNIHNVEFISYCARDKSIGNGYKKVGFQLYGYTKPGYFWTDGTNIISRFKSQKSQLKKWLSNFNSNLSESDNMFNAKFRRYWDCGNLIFKY